MRPPFHDPHATIIDLEPPRPFVIGALDPRTGREQTREGRRMRMPERVAAAARDHGVAWADTREKRLAARRSRSVVRHLEDRDRRLHLETTLDQGCRRRQAGAPAPPPLPPRAPTRHRYRSRARSRRLRRSCSVATAADDGRDVRRLAARARRGRGSARRHQGGRVAESARADAARAARDAPRPRLRCGRCRRA